MLKTLLAKNLKLPSFYSSPFVYFFCLYSSGILIQRDLLALTAISSILYYLGLLLILLYFFNRNYFPGTKLSFVLLSTLFFSLGQIQLSLLNSRNIPKIKTSNITSESLVLKLNEIEIKDSVHSKAIGTILVLKENMWVNTRKKILVNIHGKSAKNILQNDIILAITNQFDITNKNNPGEFDAITFWKSKGVFKSCYLADCDILRLQNNEANWIDHKLEMMRKYLNQILEKELDGSNLAIAKALIIGDKSLLDQETKNSFGATGAMHVLAVSGLHIGIISQLLLYIFQFFSKVIQRRNAVICVVILLWIYALLTGFSPSVVRAVFMFTVLMSAQEMGGNYSPINTLFFTAFVLALINPFVLYDIGFQLSYLAMLGIFALYKPIVAWYTPKNKVLNYLWQGSAIGFAAQAMTVPLTLYYFHQFPNYFALTNLGIMGISTVAMGFGMGIFILHFIPLIGKIASIILASSLWLMLHFLQWVESLPGSVAYGFNIPLFLVPFVMLALHLLIVSNRNRLKWKITSFVFIGLLTVISYQRYEQQNASHICFFNHNQFTMALKIKAQTIIIYDAKNDKKEKQLHGLIANYSKFYPANITFIPIKEENLSVQIGSHFVDVKKEEYGRAVRINEKLYKVIYKQDYASPILKNKKEFEIGMPWLKQSYTLSKGALIYKL
jgi:competence protein ComEC